MKLVGALCLLTSLSGHANTRIIYGEDNRVDTLHSTSTLFLRLADSTVAMIGNEKITLRGNTAELNGVTLQERFNLCDKERFIDQPSIAYCSGFLVAPDVIATAGHCMDRIGQCENFSWVFNYKITEKNQTAVSVASSEVYSCKSIIAQQNREGRDFALIKLDRPVSGHAPVQLAQQPASLGTPLVMIGHPSGLPQKIADGAQVMSVHADGFRANLDAFQINSGSAVFHARSGELVGILVNGLPDYRANEGLSCTEVNVVSDSRGDRGEGVSAVSQFAALIP
jgi:V8-like Glu-specific endopeptidase